MNLRFEKNIDKYISFLIHIFNSGLKHKMKYEDIPQVIQINVNDFDVSKGTKNM